MSKIGKFVRRFLKDDVASTSMMFGIGAVPIFMAVGVALDMGRITHAQHGMQTLADGAALTGAETVGTSVQKIQAANNYSLWR
jgi:Flp pilus assembly protein TadG